MSKPTTNVVEDMKSFKKRILELIALNATVDWFALLNSKPTDEQIKFICNEAAQKIIEEGNVYMLKELFTYASTIHNDEMKKYTDAWRVLCTDKKQFNFAIAPFDRTEIQ